MNWVTAPQNKTPLDQAAPGRAREISDHHDAPQGIDQMDDAEKCALIELVHSTNIRWFARLLSEANDRSEREQLIKLLWDETSDPDE